MGAGDYVCIRVDIRGAGRSPASSTSGRCVGPQDLASASTGLAYSHGSNGKVGLNGLVLPPKPVADRGAAAKASRGHLHLEGAADFYRDMAHHGGIFCTRLHEGLVARTGLYGAERPRNPRFKSRMNGDWVSGPETLTEEQLGATGAISTRTASPQARHRTNIGSAHAGLEQGQDTPLFYRRTGAARGCIQAAISRGSCAPLAIRNGWKSRHRALDAFLYGLRRRPAEEVLRNISSRARIPAGASSRR